MPLFWLVHEIDGERRIFIQKADGLIFARLYAAAAGFDGVFVEGHKFGEEIAEKVPEDMVGRVLLAAEVKELLARMTGDRARMVRLRQGGIAGQSPRTDEVE
jgi:hypothetical protein